MSLPTDRDLQFLTSLSANWRERYFAEVAHLSEDDTARETNQRPPTPPGDHRP